MIHLRMMQKSASDLCYCFIVAWYDDGRYVLHAREKK